MITLDAAVVGAREKLILSIDGIRMMALLVQGLPHLRERFLLTAFSPLPPFPDEHWVSGLAAGVVDRVRKGAESEITQLVYAAVFAEKGKVLVSHAGDIRVSLSQADGVLCTRDHVLSNRAAGDHLPTQDVDEVARMLPTTLTRWIGPECTADPETTRWSPRGAYRLTIATADRHGHRGVEGMQQGLPGDEGSFVEIAFDAST
jgi:hypothetical protein